MRLLLCSLSRPPKRLDKRQCVPQGSYPRQTSKTFEAVHLDHPPSTTWIPPAQPPASPLDGKKTYINLRSQPTQPLFTVLFSNDSDLPDEASRRQLDMWLTTRLETLKKAHLVLFGHTDRHGTVRYNLGLSSERVERIAALLQAEGLHIAHRFPLRMDFPLRDDTSSRRVEIFSSAVLPR